MLFPFKDVCPGRPLATATSAAGVLTIVVSWFARPAIDALAPSQFRFDFLANSTVIR